MERALRMIEISPSVLGADLMRLGDEIRRVEALGLHWLHLDHMDGHFVPNISFGPDFVRAMRAQTALFLDVHLMLSQPLRYISAYAAAGADLITVHVEAEDDAAQTLQAIHAQGVRAGISLKPETPPQALDSLLPLCDLVLVMTVEPGFGGQSLREDCLAKIPVLRSMIARANREILLEVDGGIKQGNAGQVVQAGADVLVMGTGLFRARDPQAVVRDVTVSYTHLEVRRQLMPVARRYALQDVLDACRYYIEKTGRRVIFEYALVHGVNASPEHADCLLYTSRCV